LTGGGRKIARVDVSTDHGGTWLAAQLTHGDQPWTWTFWEARVNLESGPQVIIARAFDAAANTRPEDARHIWNFKGYMNNAWHRIQVQVEN
jgi:sulfite oxidase